jgi:hypothetical protein
VDEYRDLVLENRKLKHIVNSRLPAAVSKQVMDELRPIDEELSAFARLQSMKAKAISMSPSLLEKGIDTPLASKSEDQEDQDSDYSSSSMHNNPAPLARPQTPSDICEPEPTLSSRIMELLQVAEEMDRQMDMGFSFANTGNSSLGINNFGLQQQVYPPTHPTQPQHYDVHKPVLKPKPAEISKSWFNSYNIPTFFMGV